MWRPNSQSLPTILVIRESYPIFHQLFWSIDRYEAIMQTEMSMCFSINKKHSEKKWNIVVKKISGAESLGT